MFKKVCIVGVGLIGGSLGLAIQKKRLAKFVVGVARRKRSAVEAVKAKAVQMVTMDIKEGVRGADLVILCGPVSVIASQFKSIAKYLSPGAIVIDVGSSKSLIEQAAKRHLTGRRPESSPRDSVRRFTFVGCHPMAGLEKKGCAYAQAGLFEGAVCFITRRHAKVERFWKALGCKTVLIGAREHDAWVAQFSHLPHALAFSLFQSSPKHPASLKAANPSLRDLARISKSDPSLWTDILISNRTEVLNAIGYLQKNLKTLEKSIRSKRVSAVKNFISKANRNSHQLTTNLPDAVRAGKH